MAMDSQVKKDLLEILRNTGLGALKDVKDGIDQYERFHRCVEAVRNIETDEVE